MRGRDRSVFAAIVVMVLAASLVDVLSPDASRGWAVPELKAAVEGWQGLIAVAVVLLLAGRVRRMGRLNDAVLVGSFVLAATSSALVIVSLSSSPSPALANGVTWARLATRVLLSVGLAVAALVPDRPLPPSPRATRLAVAAIVAAMLAVLVAAGDQLPTAIVRRRTGSYHVDAGVRVLLVVIVVLLAAATVGFVRRARDRVDPLDSVFALACFIATCSWIEFLGRPTVYTEDLYIGDVLRLGFWLVLLFGTIREVAGWWQQSALVAVDAERRRIARDVHDGLAQELAFITQQSQLLLEGDAPPDAQQHVVTSAQRALDESRRAIAALRDVEPESLRSLLAGALVEVTSRAGASSEIDVVELELDVDTREALVRIVREAATNAVRHGGASLVSVRLASDRVLRITDDGVGFDSDLAEPPGRYGLVSMRERAEGVGATFDVRRGALAGTVVEVELP